MTIGDKTTAIGDICKRNQLETYPKSKITIEIGLKGAIAKIAAVGAKTTTVGDINSNTSSQTTIALGDIAKTTSIGDISMAIPIAKTT